MKVSYKLVSSTRCTGNGELARSNTRFRACVKDSGPLYPKYGKAKQQFENIKKLNNLFNN